MSKLQEIESELLAVNDAVFQNVCDAILFVIERNAENISRTGSQKGKQKTIKGTPDAYFTYPNGRYGFIEYTTKSKKDSPSSFLAKVRNDLTKCLDETKTGIPVAKIIKIIYCHNSTLTPAEDAELTSICNEVGVSLELKGIDQIALLLMGRAAYAAKMFLGINIDTAQVIPVNQFIQEYEASGFATVLSNQFIGRQNEFDQLTEAVQRNKIFILKGPPGTGKSKLAVAFLQAYQKENPKTQIFCISNKNAPIFDDLRTYLKGDDDFLLFIDDANRQAGNLRSLLPMLNEQRAGKIRVIITVRDYAFDEIYHTCREFQPVTVDIPKLTDEKLTEILKSPDINIQSPKYINRILEIAEGNPRLAIMAAKVANESQNLMKLHDASEIYDQYFQNAIPDHSLFDNKVLMKAMGLISFFNAIDLTNSALMNDLMTTANFEGHQFKEAVDHLERLELVETSVDFTIVKVSDQVLSTFFFYKVFFKDNILDFGHILKRYFRNYTNRVKDSILPANNTFGYERVLEKITPSLNDFWEENQSDPEVALKFLQTFWFYRFENVFAYLWEQIEALPRVDPDFVYDEDQKEKITRMPAPYLDLLDNFFPYNLPQTDTALELSFEFVRKKPKHFTTFIKSLQEKFVFSHDDHYTRFSRQQKLFSLIYENFEDQLYNAAFYSLAPNFLRMVYRVHTASRKKNTISWYHYTIPLSAPIKTFRRKIWSLAKSKFKEYPLQTEAFVDNYLYTSPDWEKPIAVFDLPYLLAIFKKFKPANFVHCYLVEQAIWWFNRLEISTPELDALKPIFKNETYRQFRLLKFDHLKDKTEYDYEDYDEYQKLKESELRTTSLFTSLSQFKLFYKRYLFIREWRWQKRHSDFTEPLDLILEANFRANPVIGWAMIKYIIKEGNTAEIYAWRLINAALEQANVREANNFYKLLNKNPFKKRSAWMILYFDFLTGRQVNKQAMTRFLDFLETTNEDNFYIRVTALNKYLEIDPDFFLNTLRIINGKIEKLGLRWTFEHHVFENYFEYFRKDINVLQKAYLLQDDLQNSFDFNCKSLFILVDHSPTFLNTYIDFVIGERQYVTSREYSNLNHIWERQNAEKLMEDAFILVESKALISVSNSILNAFFEQLTEAMKIRALNFLKAMLKKYSAQSSKVVLIMEIVHTGFRNRQKEFLSLFLSVNNDLELFKKIDWVETSYFGPARVNVNELRAANWQIVLDNLNEIKRGAYKFANHKVFVMSQIDHYKKYAEKERRESFMRDDD
ncbi:hypothetical protein INP83_11430 [Mucilaginibacter sp. 21P]|uniref:nSTAND3 domain-containing NTPase n=1 Tax=Mucilaginibacter sp. 21P TaxID=2778902 RepID=UPI001C592517|nr:hypothetical protein [Mucilaginibacter sp. 21P]QXV63720.1 hypothetical protein INP83_11430 [Mucilaginibacter sp. 21P]